MNKDIMLVVPTIETLWFKKEIKEDPNTMDYNAGYDLDFDGYCYDDGTIKTDLDDLKNRWFKTWVGNEPSRFYYYIKQNDAFVGEVYAKFDEDRNSYEIGIVILGKYRGKGISTIAIKLLCEELQNAGVKQLYHELPMSRKSAIKADVNNGFVVVKENIDGIKKFGVIEKLVYLEKHFD